MSETPLKIKIRGDILYSPITHILLILLLGLFAYSNTFDVPFVFDDKPNIVENPLVKNFSSFFGEPSKAGVNQVVYEFFNNRISGYFSFALNYALHGLDVRGYHVVNLAIHIINAMLVYWLVLLTFRTPALGSSGLRERSKYIALFSALLFVSHPVQTQAVTYIVQRFASLATLFYLLSLTAYARARLSETRVPQYAFYAVALLSAVLAMKTKEIAFTLPLIIALYEFIFFRDSLRRRLLYLIPILLTMLIIPLALLDMDSPLGEIIGDVGETARLETEMSRLDYLFTEFRVIATYLRLLVLPVNQNLDYDYPAYTSFLDPQVFLSFLLLLSIFGLGLYLLHRSRTSDPALRVAALGIFWFFIALSVESSLVPIKDVIFEHRLYLPSVGAFMAVATAAFLLLTKFKNRKIRTIGILFLIILPIIFSAAAYKRNTIWASKISLWEDVVKKSPNKARAHTSLGTAYEARGLLDDAFDHYEEAIRLNPESTAAHNNIGNIYKNRGKFDKAVAHYRKALAIYPYYSSAYHNLGSLYSQQGQFDMAIEHLVKAMQLNPGDDMTRNAMGTVYLLKGDIALAIEHYQAAIELRPENFKAQYNLAVAYYGMGLTDKAIDHYERAINLKPDYADAYSNLGIVYKAEGQLDKAIGYYERALSLKPDNPEAHYNLGNAYMLKGLTEKAIEHYEHAISLNPDDPDYHKNLAVAYQQKGLHDQSD